MGKEEQALLLCLSTQEAAYTLQPLFSFYSIFFYTLGLEIKPGIGALWLCIL